MRMAKLAAMSFGRFEPDLKSSHLRGVGRESTPPESLMKCGAANRDGEDREWVFAKRHIFVAVLSLRWTAFCPSGAGAKMFACARPSSCAICTE
jgi:hypothetical protein